MLIERVFVDSSLHGSSFHLIAINLIQAQHCGA